MALVVGPYSCWAARTGCGGETLAASERSSVLPAVVLASVVETEMHSNVVIGQALKLGPAWVAGEGN